MDNQQHKKNMFYICQPCLHGVVVQPTGAHTCAPVHPTGTHMCTPIQYTGTHMCTPVHFIGALSGALIHYTGTQICMPVQPTGAHMCTPVQPIGTPIVRAHYPLTGARMCVYPVGRRARVHTYYRIAHACGAHTPKHPCTALRTTPAQKIKP